MVVRVCDNCENVQSCPVCGEPVTGFNHVGVRAALGSVPTSGIWHIALPCGHAKKLWKNKLLEKMQGTGGLATYNGGPLWQAGYKWQPIYWGTYWGDPKDFTPDQVDKAIQDIENDPSYSGYLSEYNVGIGSVLPRVIVAADPPSTIDDSAIGPQIQSWIQAGLIPELGQQGAYSIFFPPGVIVTLQGSASCKVFCDYHNFDGTHAYTVEPYPCTAGCNRCSESPFDTLTEGLSEEMVELKTDMNPGTGWVIGNEELCDWCDASYVCDQISGGEYVNAWYSNGNGVCWTPTMPAPQSNPPLPNCSAILSRAAKEIEAGDIGAGVEDLIVGIECVIASGILSRKELLKRVLEKL